MKERKAERKKETRREEEREREEETTCDFPPFCYIEAIPSFGGHFLPESTIDLLITNGVTPT